MHLVRLTLAATAAACLLGGAAVAGSDMSGPADTNAGPSSAPADQSAAPADPSAASTDQSAPASAPAATSSAADTSANVGVTVVASQPVPDTPENRAKYGQPMSRAGKHTAARGN